VSPELAVGRIIEKLWQRDSWKLAVAANNWIEISGETADRQFCKRVGEE
jgi:hypothetical protein